MEHPCPVFGRSPTKPAQGRGGQMIRRAGGEAAQKPQPHAFAWIQVLRPAALLRDRQCREDVDVGLCFGQIWKTEGKGLHACSASGDTAHQALVLREAIGPGKSS